MSGETMDWPDNWWAFVQDYQFKDSDEAYTNGSMLIQSFRVRQMCEHYFGAKVGESWDKAEEDSFADGIDMQAIADELNRLGSGTCKQEERGWSTEGDHARVWLTCGHDCMVPTVQDLPNYCPNCGAKVVDE